MPRPPAFDGLTDLKFITNYMLLGCVPPFWAVIEFSREPLWDVAMLAIGLSADDIAQAVLDPAGSRRQRPGRHGRKSGRTPFQRARDLNKRIYFPDVSDIVGTGIRAKVNPGNALNFGPVRKAFRVNDFFEGIAFKAAVVDGLTDVAFETLWGILSLDRNHCRNLYRIARHSTFMGTGGGITLPFDPINIDALDMTVDFFDGEFGTGTSKGPFHIAFETMVRSAAPPYPFKGGIAIKSDVRGIVAQSPFQTWPFDEWLPAAVEYRSPGDEFLTWGFYGDEGFANYYNARVLAFADVPIF